MLRWLLASVPLILLLLCLMKFRLGARKAGLLSWVAALAVAWASFGATWDVLLLSSLKGASLTLYVATIIWTSTFMFRMVFETGKFGLVSEYMGTLASNKLVLGLLIAWCASGVIQGIAGYGVPVAVCAPLMIAAGFEPLTGIVAVLVGHSWSVTFGSMGSSFHALAMSTGYAPDVLGNAVGLGFIFPTVVTGFCVGHIVGGVRGLKASWIQIAAVGGSMGLVQWILARIGLGQVAALLASLTGLIAIVLIGRRRSGVSHQETSGSVESRAKKATLVRILGPYATLLVVAAIGQVAKRYAKSPKFGFDFPATVTSQGFEVAASKAYAAIDLFTHPAPLILVATVICLPILLRSGLLDRPRLTKAVRSTVGQALPTTLGILTMVMMALVMMDSGMTAQMARGVANVTGWLFPLFSPFIGVLGCFMTGSNTNSNVLFSAFQIQTAEILSISPLVVATAQTVGGSLGSAIAPAKVFLGASTAGLNGQESEVLRRAVGYCLLIVALVGVQALAFSMVGK